MFDLSFGLFNNIIWYKDHSMHIFFQYTNIFLFSYLTKPRLRSLFIGFTILWLINKIGYFYILKGLQKMPFRTMFRPNRGSWKSSIAQKFLFHPASYLRALKTIKVSHFQRHWIYKRQLHHHWPLGLGAVKCKLVESGGDVKAHRVTFVIENMRHNPKLWFSHPTSDAWAHPQLVTDPCEGREICD